MAKDGSDLFKGQLAEHPQAEHLFIRLVQRVQALMYCEGRRFVGQQLHHVRRVCGGIGEYFGIDPTVVRLIWALFSLMGGCGILAYIIAAVIIPRNPVC